MPFTTESALINLFGEAELLQLTDRQKTGAIDENVLDAAIALADGDILPSLAAYDAPETLTDPILVRIAADLTRWYLYGDFAPEIVAERQRQAREDLRSIAKQVLKLAVGGGNQQPAEAAYDAPNRLMDDTTMEGW